MTEQAPYDKLDCRGKMIADLRAMADGPGHEATIISSAADELEMTWAELEKYQRVALDRLQELTRLKAQQVDNCAEQVGATAAELVQLADCPFCGMPLRRSRSRINPSARCVTEDCYGAKMPVVNEDVPSDVEAWNTRAAQQDAWQPIETFPQDGEAYLASDNRVQGGFPQVVYWDDWRLHVPDAGISYPPTFFTHWKRIDQPDARVEQIRTPAEQIKS